MTPSCLNADDIALPDLISVVHDVLVVLKGVHGLRLCGSKAAKTAKTLLEGRNTWWQDWGTSRHNLLPCLFTGFRVVDGLTKRQTVTLGCHYSPVFEVRSSSTAAFHTLELVFKFLDVLGLIQCLLLAKCDLAKKQEP